MSCFGTNFVVTVRKLLHRQIRQHVPTSEVDPTLFKTTLGQKFGPQGYSLDVSRINNIVYANTASMIQVLDADCCSSLPDCSRHLLYIKYSQAFVKGTLGCHEPFCLLGSSLQAAIYAGIQGFG